MRHVQEYCIACGGEFKNELSEHFETILGVRYSAPVEAEICQQCGQEFPSIEGIASVQAGIARTLCIRDKVRNGKAHSFCRSVLELSIKELAEIYGVDPIEIELMETNRTPIPDGIAERLSRLVAIHLAGLDECPMIDAAPLVIETPEEDDTEFPDRDTLVCAAQ